MTAPEPSKGLLERLHQNEVRNREAFAAADISSDQIRIIRCKACGIPENALFWTHEGRTGAKLLLRCPTCDEYSYKYPLTPSGADRWRGFKLFHRAETIIPAFLIGMLLCFSIATLNWERLGELRGIGAGWIAGLVGERAGGARRTSSLPSPPEANGPVSPGLPSPSLSPSPYPLDPVILGEPGGSYTGTSPSIEFGSLWPAESRPERSRVYVKAGDQREAISDLERALPVDSSEPESKQWEVHYDAERDQSRITILTPSAGWESWLIEQGWHRVDRNR